MIVRALLFRGHVNVQVLGSTIARKTPFCAINKQNLFISHYYTPNGELQSINQEPESESDAFFTA